MEAIAIESVLNIVEHTTYYCERMYLTMLMILLTHA